MTTIDEIIYSLEDQARDKDSLAPEDEPDNILAQDARALRAAAKLLRTQQAANAPLTLEELRKMDGEPVWVVGVSSINNFKGHWDICDGVGGKLIAFPYCLESPNEDEYGITWLAYRRKPEDTQ